MSFLYSHWNFPKIIDPLLRILGKIIKDSVNWISSPFASFEQTSILLHLNFINSVKFYFHLLCNKKICFCVSDIFCPRHTLIWALPSFTHLSKKWKKINFKFIRTKKKERKKDSYCLIIVAWRKTVNGSFLSLCLFVSYP